MKHVGSAAPFRQTIMVTGFGAFPGASRNPTADILRRLESHRGRLALGAIDLRCVLLPVIYAAVGPALDDAVRRHRPDAVLHLGLASRRRRISIETRAVNRSGPLHHDAASALPRQILAPGEAPALRATYPARQLLAALRRAGHDVALSIDAGDYVCNATLYHSLRGALAPSVGFLHVPRARRITAIARDRVGPTTEALTDATLTAVKVIARSRWTAAWREVKQRPS